MRGYRNWYRKHKMDALPDEMLIHIFTFISGMDLEKCYRVSMRWATLIRFTPSIWEGSITHKAIGLNEKANTFVTHLYLFKFARYIDYSERAYDYVDPRSKAYKVLTALKKRGKYIEVIRLRDPYILIGHIKTLLTLPGLKELQVIIRELGHRQERLHHLKLQFKAIQLPLESMFFNELKFTWKRDGKKNLTLFQEDLGPNPVYL